MKKLHRFLDSITSYRVVLYSLAFLTVTALSLSALNILSYSSFGTLSLTLLLLLGVSFLSNILFGRLYKVAINHESSIITALILFFVLASPSKASDWAGVALAALLAMASKYLITWRSTHIFNPSAFGVLAVSLIGIGSGAWWIADKSLLIPMLVVGFVVLTKIRRFELFFAFIVATLLMLIVKSPANTSLINLITSSFSLYPILFLGTIMLTEPATMPSTRINRAIFAVITGLIFVSNMDFGFIATSPHLALIVANVFAFLVTMRSGAYLKLVEKKQLTPTTYSFAFEPSRPVAYKAGQYMEFTMPGVKIDTRGNRRTFTIASSPQDKLIKIGVKFYNSGSQFKNKLQGLKIGDTIMGGHVAGDFILPKSQNRPVVFIAGGIGITPFIAMLEEHMSTKSKRPVALYYFIADKNELAYKGLLKTAKNMGVDVQLRIGKGVRLTEDDIKSKLDSDFYLSGPPGMVGAYKAQLQNMKVQTIHTDLFTGY